MFTPRSASARQTFPRVLPALEAWLRVRSDDSEWLFPDEAGKPYYERNLLRRELWPVCDRLGVPRFGWHSLGEAQRIAVERMAPILLPSAPSSANGEGGVNVVIQ
jgi:hypothetical protein